MWTEVAQLREIVASPSTSSALGPLYASFFFPATQSVRVHPDLLCCDPCRHQATHHDQGNAWV